MSSESSYLGVSVSFATDFLSSWFWLQCFGSRDLNRTSTANSMLTMFRGLGCRGAQPLERVKLSFAVE